MLIHSILSYLLTQDKGFTKGDICMRVSTLSYPLVTESAHEEEVILQMTEVIQKRKTPLVIEFWI